MSDKKEVLVVGFGAVGAIYAFIITRGGKANVTCVARGSYEETQANGINIKSTTYGDTQGWRPHRLVRTVSEAADRPYSYVILTTKALPGISSTSSLLEPLYLDTSGHPLPTFVFVQNGLSVEKDLYEAVKKVHQVEPKIISTALWIGTNLLEGNVVDHSHPERICIGAYRPSYPPDVTNTAEETAMLQGFADYLEAANSEVQIADEVQRVKFRKNIWNAVYGTCSALVQYPLPAFLLDEAVEGHVIPQLRAMMLEVIAVGRAMGFDEKALPLEAVENVIRTTAEIHTVPGTTHRASTLLDRDNGRPMEVEVLIGELVRSAREHHVDAPRLELVYALLSVVQNQLVHHQ